MKHHSNPIHSLKTAIFLIINIYYLICFSRKLWEAIRASMLILFYKLQRFRWIKKACPRSRGPGTSKSDLKAKFSDIKTLPLYSIALLLLTSNGFVKSCFVK